MTGSSGFIVIVVGILVLAAVLRGRAGCFSAFLGCLFGAASSSSTTVPPASQILPNITPVGTTGANTLNILGGQ